MENFETKLKTQFPSIKFGEILANYNNFRIGAAADYLYIVRQTEEIVELVRLAYQFKVPFFMMGRGTNMLFSDNEFRGLVIVNHSRKITREGELIIADSGVSLSDIINFGLKEGLGGMESLFCLPGTVGGAVFGNAGSFGLETKDFIEWVEYYDVLTDKIERCQRAELEFEYRNSTFKKKHRSKWIILRVALKLTPLQISPEAEQAKLREIARLRQSKQPPGATCGSFFKNIHLPDGKVLYVGKMVEDCGLKGTRIGAAQISQKHGNFLLNLGGAKAAEVLELARLIKEKVQAKFAVELEQEVIVLT